MWCNSMSFPCFDSVATRVSFDDESRQIALRRCRPCAPWHWWCCERTIPYQNVATFGVTPPKSLHDVSDLVACDCGRERAWWDMRVNRAPIIVLKNKEALHLGYVSDGWGQAVRNLQERLFGREAAKGRSAPKIEKMTHEQFGKLNHECVCGVCHFSACKGTCSLLEVADERTEWKPSSVPYAYVRDVCECFPECSPIIHQQLPIKSPSYL